MSYGSQDGRSHPRVRRFGRDLLGSKWGVKIDESAEDTVVLLSQFGGIRFRVLNEIGIFDIGLKGFHIDGLQLTVCDGLGYSEYTAAPPYNVAKDLLALVTSLILPIYYIILYYQSLHTSHLIGYAYGICGGRVS